METIGNDQPGPVEVALMLAIALLAQTIVSSGKQSNAVSQEGEAG